MDDSRWYVNFIPTDTKGRTYSDFYFGMARITWAKENHLAARPQPAVSLYAGESDELRDFITELVHEIERLQTENIALNDECDMLQDIANADSANYITPGNWGGYT